MTLYAPDIEELLGPADSSGGDQAMSSPAVKVPAAGGGAITVSGPGAELAIAGEPYEGASRFDTALALWNPSTGSADSDMLDIKPQLDARTRDTIRNDAYVQGGAQIHRDDIVGAMYLLNAKPVSRRLFGKVDDVWETEFQEEVEETFTLAAESDNHWFDASRHNTFTELVRLAVGGYVSGGEVLASAEWLSKDSSRPFATAIQMIDPDRLSTPWDMINDKTIRAGVRSDRNRAPISYFVQVEHPNDYRWSDFRDIYKWREVPVRKPWGRLQMIHIFEQARVDQTRGMSDMVAGLKECRTTKKIRDVALQNAVVQATYAATIESDLDTKAIFERLGGGANPGTDEYAKAVKAYMGGHMSAMSEFMGGAKNLRIDGVKIPHLPAGAKLQMRAPGSGGPQGSNLEQSLLRYISAILGVSYEALSHDYSNTNYSSFKGAQNQSGKFMASRKKMVADPFANAIYRLWLEEHVNRGLITSMPARARRPGWLYEDKLRLDALSACEWIGASRGQIDELKETQAAVLRVNNNLTTLEGEHGRLGQDWRKVLKQRAREKAMMELLGLPDTAPTTNMVNASTGAPRDKESTEQDGKEADSADDE